MVAVVINGRSPMKPPFPKPVYFGRRRHFRLSELVAYERELAGLPPEPTDPSTETFLTAAQVRARYGGVSDMWLHRRLAERDGAAA
jgi:hypothetical protein